MVDLEPVLLAHLGLVPDGAPVADRVGVEARVALEEAVELGDVGGRHVGAGVVQGAEGLGEAGVAEPGAFGEQFAADEGVDVVAAAPELPPAADVLGRGDGFDALPVGLCGILGQRLLLFFR